MSTTTIISLLVAVAVIATIAVYVKMSRPTKEQVEMAQNFVNSLKDNIIDIVEDVIEVVQSDKYNDFDTYKETVFAGIYEASWEFVERMITDNVHDAPTKRILLKLINKNNVEETVDTLLKETPITDRLGEIFDSNASKVIQSMVEEDKEAEVIAQAYEDGTVQVDDIDVKEAEAVPETVIAVETPEDPDDINIEESSDIIEVVSEEEIPDVIGAIYEDELRPEE